MNPIDPGDQYGDLAVYAANQPQYNPLPSRVDVEGGTLTKWELTEEEVAALVQGAKLGLRILTFGQPLQPIYLFVEGTERDPYEQASS